MAQKSSPTMLKLDSTEEVKPGFILPFSDDKECEVLFVLNDTDLYVDVFEKRVLH